MEQAEAVGDAPADPLLLFSLLFGLWAANYVAFDGDVCRDLSAQFLALAEKQGTAGLRMVGHRLMGQSLLLTGAIAESRVHYDQTIGLYQSAAHRQLAARFGQDVRVATLCVRSLALWALGYPNAALLDSEQALIEAREIGHAATLMYALALLPWTHLFCGNYARANVMGDELIGLADEKGTPYWRAYGMVLTGSVSALTGHTSDAIATLSAGALAYAPQEQLDTCQFTLRTWRRHTQTLDNWRTLGTGFAQP
jgi:hypothetical protein